MQIGPIVYIKGLFFLIAGWKTFMKRRTAVAKINSLPFATEEELRKHDDVCAICYMDMTNAKVTRCRHFFHSVCLRKWLYMQDTCPLCHAVLYKDQSEKAKKATPNAAADTNENNTDSSPEVLFFLYVVSRDGKKTRIFSKPGFGFQPGF